MITAEAEKELIKRIQNGEISLYENLVDEYKDFVFKVVRRHVPVENVQEVAHIVFVEAYKALLRAGEIRSFKAWIATLATRRCYDFWRAEKRKRKEVPMSALSEGQQYHLESMAADEAQAEHDEQSDSAAARGFMESVLEQLSPEDRMVVVLMYIEERSVKETAQMLGWTTTNTKVRAFRARKKLAKMLEQMGLGEKR